MDSSEELELLQPIRKSNGTYENPFPKFSLPSGGVVCRFLRDRIAQSLSGPASPSQVHILGLLLSGIVPCFAY